MVLPRITLDKTSARSGCRSLRLVRDMVVVKRGAGFMMMMGSSRVCPAVSLWKGWAPGLATACFGLMGEETMGLW